MTKPRDSAGARLDEAELSEYLTELEELLRALGEWTVEDFQVQRIEGVPIVELIFIDHRVPKIRFRFRKYIWDPDPVVWWANFMEDTEACLRWRNADPAPTDIVRMPGSA